MAWLRLTIETIAEQVETLTALLEQFDASAVSYQPVSDENLFDDGCRAEPAVWQQTSVTALLDAEIDIDILLACIRNRIGTENITGHRIEAVQDQDWSQVHKPAFPVMVFAGRLMVRPDWETSAAAALPCITLAPGLAFGTGRHATTALCLEWLAGRDLSGKTVIDYGCGSGILSIAAARLGASQVYAVDIDPQALLATSQNAERNQLLDRIQLAATPDPGWAQADILVANILLNPLLQLAPEFAGQVKPGGEIALSGLLAGQVPDCLDCYGQWFKMGTPEYRDEWSLLQGRR